MNKLGYVLALEFILAALAAVFVGLFILPKKENGTSFNAENARKLSESAQVKQRKEEWNWKDTLELKKVENLIKRCCKKGRRELRLNSSLRSRVVEKLRANGYKVVFVQTIDGSVIGVQIEW